MSGREVSPDDERFMAEAVALGGGARGRTAPNPNVGCVIVADGAIVGRGATAPGGRPHAEAIALAEAGSRAEGATLYTTLEPCAHRSARGPTCAALIAEAGVRRVVAAMADPDPRTAGAGFAALRSAGVVVETGCLARAASAGMAGYLTRLKFGRPRITLKLALSIDGKIATASGESQWISGEDARADVHRERAQCDMVLVGRGTYLADSPRLDVRLPGLEDWSPRRALLTHGEAVDGWETLHSPQDVYGLHDVNDLMVEGGAATATAFLAADLVDRLLVYRAPIILGAGTSAFGDIGLGGIADAHGRWRVGDGVALGVDRREVYERVRGA